MPRLAPTFPFVLSCGLALAALAAPSHGLATTTVEDEREAPVTGDGHKVTQSRPATAVKSIRLEGAIDVEVEAGAPPALAVTIDENLQPRLETRVEGDTLIISSRSMRYEGRALVKVSTPALRRFELVGSGNVGIRGASGDSAVVLSGSGNLAWQGSAAKADIELSGSGNVTLSGKAGGLTVRLEGSGNVDAEALAAHDAEADLSGSGDIRLRLDGGRLAARVEGSGDIRWSGTAAIERTSVTGSGTIRRR